jgi:hypothetical protein
VAALLLAKWTEIYASQFFWYVLLCHTACISQRFTGKECFYLKSQSAITLRDPEEEGITSLRNVCDYLKHGVTPQNI